MNHKASSFAFLAIFLLFSSASAFNITKLLGKYPEFSSFNDYLTKTQLYDQINRRQTITVLAVDNDALAAIAGKPLEVVKKILSVHVVLDYFDVEKLSQLSQDKDTQITTLFQASGQAVNQQGFLKVSLINEGEIAFGSAVKGSSFDAKLVQSVAAQPYNISVLQITSAIQVPGIESSPSHPPPPTAAPVAAPPKKVAPSKSPAVAPSAKPKVEAPAPSAESATAPVAETPSEIAGDAPESALTPSVADAPEALGPEADAAPIGSPISSPPQPADVFDDNAEAPASNPSGAGSTVIGGGVMMGLVSFLVAFYF